MRNICLIANKRAVVMQNSTTGLLLLFAILHIKTVFFLPVFQLKKKTDKRVHHRALIKTHTHTKNPKINKNKTTKPKKGKEKKPTHSQ